MSVSISISITQNSQSVANNTSNVTVQVTAKWTYGSYNHLEKPGKLVIDGTSYVFVSPFNINNTTSGTSLLYSKTLNIAHGSNGAKTLSCSASYTSGVSSGTVTASASKTLTTIPRASTLSASNGTLGTAQTLTVTKKASSFTHTITYKCGSVSGTIASKSSDTSISWKPDLSLAEQNTAGTTVSVTLTITTYNGSTSVGSASKTISCAIPDSLKPSCSVSVEDPTGYDWAYGAYVKGRSKLKVTVTPTLSYKSPIASYSVSANGGKYTTASFTTGVLKSSGNLTVSATVKDKRGRSASASTSVTAIDYDAPSISKLTVHRCKADGTANDQGEYVKVVFSASVSPLNNYNSANYTLEYKKTTESEYTPVALDDLRKQYAVTDYSYIFPAETGSSYNVKVSVADDLDSDAKTTSASTASTLMHWLASGLGMAIGKIAELTNVFDIGFQTRFMGGILHPVLEPDTDLNEIRTPNTYVGADVSRNNYANCPLTSGTFTLEVVGMGEAGQVKQKVTYCHKTNARAWERIYYAESWGNWICVSDFKGQLLWSGGYYMTSSQSFELPEPVSKQKSGIVLVFSAYADGEAKNNDFVSKYIPKLLISTHASVGHVCPLSTADFSYVGSKMVYISDTRVTGHDFNSLQGTKNGVTFDNKHWVLRYVIGV